MATKEFESEDEYKEHLLNEAITQGKIIIREGKDGHDGKDGVDGKDGKDGVDGKDGKDGVDGKDGKDGVDGKDGKDGNEIEPMQIADKLNTLDGVVEKSVIKGLEEELKKINKKLEDSDKTVVLGGGVSDKRVVMALRRMVTSETPSGAINGVNTTYTVSRDISSVINFTINGQFIHPDEYSVAGATITFDTALDSSLSGTSFTMTYV